MPNETNDLYPWYRIAEAEDNIEQGDFFYRLPILFPTSKITELSTELEVGTEALLDAKTMVTNCIVITHSCDFQETTADEYQVLVCPIFEVSQDSQSSQHLPKDKWKSLVRGRETKLHLLEKFETSEQGLSFFYQIVELSNVYSIPYGVLKVHAKSQGNRVRLQSPYREHLSQAFARRFMRVGLPKDLPREKPY